MQASEMTLEQHCKHVNQPGPQRDFLLRLVKEFEAYKTRSHGVAEITSTILELPTVGAEYPKSVTKKSKVSE